MKTTQLPISSFNGLLLVPCVRSLTNIIILTIMLSAKVVSMLLFYCRTNPLVIILQHFFGQKYIHIILSFIFLGLGTMKLLLLILLSTLSPCFSNDKISIGTKDAKRSRKLIVLFCSEQHQLVPMCSFKITFI